MAHADTTRRWYYYPLAHWRGEQNFAWSFWVNLVALRLAIFITQRQFDPGIGHDYTQNTTELLTLAMFAHGVLLIWQIGGVLRAGEKFISAGGSIVEIWGSYIGVLIAFWVSLSYAFDAWQWTLPYPGKNWQVVAPDRFKITIDKTGQVAEISGEIGLGLTKKFAVFLDQNSQIQIVVLNSRGGNVYEARGVSKLIREKGLSTRVDKVCHSSCTTIFIGGKKRTLSGKGQLGFHKYRMDAKYQVGFGDVKLEQMRDRSLFLDAGVKDGFVSKMFAYEVNEMWYPDTEQLRRSGVITTAKHNDLKFNLFSGFPHTLINGNAFYQGINLHARL